MVSIIIPVYNVEKYLDECVESVLKLKTEIEVILVDDGSKDQSGFLCDSWAQKDDRIRVIHQENGGLSAARNTGIRASKGDYIMFLDSDDFLDSEETDRMLCAQNSKADSIFGLYKKYFGVENVSEKEKNSMLEGMLGLKCIEDFLKAVPSDGQTLYMVAVRFVVSREMLLRNHLFFLSGIYHEDEEWTGRLLCASKTIFITDCYFYQYRQTREGSITSSIQSKHIQDSMRVLQQHAKLSEKYAIDSIKNSYLHYRMAQLFLNIILNIYVLDKKQRNIMYEKLSDYRGICVPYLSGLIGKSAKLFIYILGIKGTCYILKLARCILK